MFESTQILIIAVVLVLTLLLSVIGFQVFLIFRELQKTVMKINKMLDDAGLISESIAKPIASFSGIVSGVSGVAGLLGLLNKKKGKKNE